MIKINYRKKSPRVYNIEKMSYEGGEYEKGFTNKGLLHSFYLYEETLIAIVFDIVGKVIEIPASDIIYPEEI